MHSPFSNQRIFLLFADLVGDFQRYHPGRFAGVRFVIQALDALFHPAP
jgi:hypothetical protein